MAFEQPSLFDDSPVRAAQDGGNAGSTVHQGPASLVECERAVDEGPTVNVPSHASGDSRERPAPEWQEVPAVLFLSWSDARQLEYCARRDEVASAAAETVALREFYGARAAAYRFSLAQITLTER